MLRLMNFNELLVFIVIRLMCFTHDKSREILTPKYLAESASFRLTTWRVQLNRVGVLLFVTLMTSHLSVLNAINRSLSQVSSFESSD